MNKYYFTFGTDENFPYQGGWVEVYAETLKEAIQKFKNKFPNRCENIINCASYYTEKQFKKSGMLEGNLGKKCHKTII